MTVSFRLPPCCVVRGLFEGRLALRAGRPVTLLSAPGAASFGGSASWIAPGRALEALRLGQHILVFTGEAPAEQALRERAAALGATVLAERPPALDLWLYVRAPDEAARRLARLLSGSTPDGL